MNIKKVAPGQDPCVACKELNHARPCYNNAPRFQQHGFWTMNRCKQELRDNEIPDFTD